MNLKERAKQLKNDIPAVFLALKDAKTPLSAKLVAGLAVVYALSPVDLIPDFIPLLGYLDDVLLLPALVALAVKLIPPDVFACCRERAKGMWENGAPKRWYFALPVAALWLLAAWLVIKGVFFSR